MVPAGREELRDRLAAALDLAGDGRDGDAAGQSYLAAMEGLLADAEAFGDPEVLFGVRVVYANALRFKAWENEPREVDAEALAVLRTCLLMWHAEPHRFDGVDVGNMWTEFHRVVDRYIRHAPEPAGQVSRLIDELERRCPPDRPHARYALGELRVRLEARRGNAAEAERLWRLQLARGPAREHLRPDMVAALDASMWARLGRHDLAVAALAPVLNGRIPTGGEPHEVRLLMPYLHTGRAAEAVAAHRRTWARTGMMFDELAAHMEFCARTGNEERGLDVLHRNFDCVAFSFRAVEGMWAMAAVALLCLRASAKGLDREVCVPCYCGGLDEDCDWLPLLTYAKLAKQLRWAALDHAEHLGELDGTPHLFEAVDALLFAEPVPERPELGPGPDVASSGRTAVPPSPHLRDADAAGLRAALRRARAPEPGRPRIMRTQRVVHGATAGGFADVVVAARFALLNDMLLDGFESWRLDLFAAVDELFRLRDERPDLFGAGRTDVLWRALPTMAERVLARPGPLLRQVRDLLDRAERHCRPGTEDLHRVRWFRAEAAARTGDAAALRAAWAEFRELPEAGRYARRAAVLRRARWWIDVGCDEEAFAVLGPLVADGDEREDLLLMPYLRAGLVERAREAHERTYATASGAPEVAAHLMYCAETGEPERGAEIILRTLDLLDVPDHDEFPFDRLELTAAAVRVSEAVAATGLDRTWTWTYPDEPDQPDEPDWSFARLADDCRVTLRLYARRWDEIAGTSVHTRAAADAVGDPVGGRG